MVDLADIQAIVELRDGKPANMIDRLLSGDELSQELRDALADYLERPPKRRKGRPIKLSKQQRRHVGYWIAIEHAHGRPLEELYQQAIGDLRISRQLAKDCWTEFGRELHPTVMEILRSHDG